MAQSEDRVFTPGNGLAEAPGPGDSFPIDRFSYKSIQAIVPGGSYTLEFSNDGANWQQHGAALSANALLDTENGSPRLPMQARFMRFVTATHNPGAIFAFSGYVPRP